MDQRVSTAAHDMHGVQVSNELVDECGIWDIHIAFNQREIFEGNMRKVITRFLEQVY
jgi:hypothetical protein